MSTYAVRPGQRVVVVTGATGATGRATCAALLTRGERVVAVGRDPESLVSSQTRSRAETATPPTASTRGPVTCSTAKRCVHSPRRS